MRGIVVLKIRPLRKREVHLLYGKLLEFYIKICHLIFELVDLIVCLSQLALHCIHFFGVHAVVLAQLVL